MYKEPARPRPHRYRKESLGEIIVSEMAFCYCPAARSGNLTAVRLETSTMTAPAVVARRGRGNYADRRNFLFFFGFALLSSIFSAQTVSLLLFFSVHVLAFVGSVAPFLFSSSSMRKSCVQRRKTVFLALARACHVLFWASSRLLRVPDSVGGSATLDCCTSRHRRLSSCCRPPGP